MESLFTEHRQPNEPGHHSTYRLELVISIVLTHTGAGLCLDGIYKGVAAWLWLSCSAVSAVWVSQECVSVRVHTCVVDSAKVHL